MAPTTHHLAKRDEELILPKIVIQFLIMLGAVCVTCLAYAVHRTWGFGPNSNGIKPITVEQMEYMAEVRVRNMNALAREGRLAWHHGRMYTRDHETMASAGTSSGM
jgi:hypothetical protein